MFNPPPHKQSVYFNDGSVRVVEDVVKVEQGNWYHLMTKDGTEYIMNPTNVNFVRINKSK